MKASLKMQISSCGQPRGDLCVIHVRSFHIVAFNVFFSFLHVCAVFPRHQIV